MVYVIFKAVISGILIAIISEVAKRSPDFGALIASLPLVSVLAMIWLWHDTHDFERIAQHAQTTFWLVLPSLPMFLILPLMLRLGHSFYVSLALCCVVTILLYGSMLWVLRYFNISF